MARQLEKHGLLEALYTGYPRFKLSDEPGYHLAKSSLFLGCKPHMARGKIGLDRWKWLNSEWAWHAHQTLDRYVASKIKYPTILIALSGSGLHSGRKAQQLDGIHICDRGSSHIRAQERLLREEFERYGTHWSGIDPRSIAKEEAEYEQADLISIPSQFCYDSFIQQGVSAAKLHKIPYGARLERFYPECSSPEDKDQFRVLFVGAAGPRRVYRPTFCI